MMAQRAAADRGHEDDARASLVATQSEPEAVGPNWLPDYGATSCFAAIQGGGQRGVEEARTSWECRSIRSGASGLPYYCAPLVCISVVIELLAVWRHNKPKTKNQSRRLIDDCFYYTCNSSLVPLLEGLCRFGFSVFGVFAGKTKNLKYEPEPEHS